MDIREAFGQLINEKGWYKRAGLSVSHSQQIRKRFKDGVSLTEEKMREILIAAGYEVVMPEQWKPRVPDPIIIEKKVRVLSKKAKVIVRTLIEPEYIKEKVIYRTQRNRNKDVIEQFSHKGRLKKKRGE